MHKIVLQLCSLSALALLIAMGSVGHASSIALDPAFGVGGILRVPALVPIDAALQAGGKLLIVGQTNPPPGDFVVARFNRDGSADTGFGMAGVLRPQANGFPFLATVLLALQDGRFLIAGVGQQRCAGSLCSVNGIVRLSIDGDVDLSFGTSGFALLSHLAVKLASRPDGSVIVLEDSSIPCGLSCPTHSSSIEAVSADGTLIANVSNPCLEILEDLVVRPDGKAVVVAAEGDPVHGLQQCIARFKADGPLDLTFGTNGIRHLPQATSGLPSLLVDPRDPMGRIVTSTGSGAFQAFPPGSMVRLLPDGSNDPAFGDPGNGHLAPTRAKLLALGCASKMIGAYATDVFVSGTPLLTPPGIHLLRYNSNGVPDSTFTGDASGEFFTMLNDLDEVKRLAIRDDGEVVVIGSVEQVPAPASLFIAAFRQSDCTHSNNLQALPVIEYRNASLDHYFITNFVDDMNALDSGHFPGWSRTGYTFNADNGSGGLSPVCRFYIPPPYGDSHFFSASPVECAGVASRFPQFALETSNAMNIGLPLTNGFCPGLASVPVYRVWDNRPDTNHRYITDRGVRNAMVALGWIAEGNGLDAVAMCALPQ